MTNPSPLPALEELTAKIVRAVPDLATVECHECDQEWSGYFTQCPDCMLGDMKRTTKPYRPIGLEDVFQWIREETRTKGDSLYCIDKWGSFFRADKGIVLARWEFGKSLSDQTPETIAFLNDLLPSGV